ncbi:DNA-3-methyladenine glycosylase II [Syntrophobacter sp. SbD1]|nr:DNA-3-methyladenine glycosylase II [Syntrophobacter sp. SbD1]
MKAIQFSLRAPAPFRLDLTAWVLRRREANRIDSLDATTYRRVMPLGSQIVTVSVEQEGPAERPELRVSLFCKSPSSQTGLAARTAITRLLGLNVSLGGFYAMAQADPHLGPLVERFRGVKPPLYPTLFEAIANAIVFQQISLDAGISVLNRLALTYGDVFDCGQRPCYLFPSAHCLAGLRAEEVKKAGMSSNKARALVECAQTIIERGLSIDYFEKMDNESVVAELVKFRGIGRWSADYVLLRGLGRLNVFPKGDTGARAALNRWLNPEGRLSDAELKIIMSKWRDYAGLIYFHLLLRGLAEKGVIA